MFGLAGCTGIRSHTPIGNSIIIITNAGFYSTPTFTVKLQSKICESHASCYICTTACQTVKGSSQKTKTKNIWIFVKKKTSVEEIEQRLGHAKKINVSRPEFFLHKTRYNSENQNTLISGRSKLLS